MSDKKIHFVSSDNEAAKEAKDNLVKKYKDYPASEADVIVTLGGDGLMLQTLHNNIDEAKPIFGINKGSVGFLMNDYNDDDLLERIDSATLTKVYPLQMTVKTEKEEISAKAINEVSLLRQTYQAAKIKIKIDDKIRLEELICDGILLATPAGSTAYNLSAHGPILPINSNLLALTPISAFRPRRWKGALLPHDSIVEIEILEKTKRPVSAVADNLEIRDIESVKITEDRKTELFMLFDPETNLEEKILEEQFTYS
ncbi:MAG: NAD kinase [Alphaproteobacteria bacterium]|tara:strand:- start:2220 stop:2987 length:768 start_codon:yes stop_codon:yes gene_type:complete